MLQLMLTDKCNLNCKYCYEGQKDTYVMTEEIGKRAIDMYYDTLLDSYGDSEFFPISYHGGEPLLEFPLMKKLTEYAVLKLEQKDVVMPKRCAFIFTTNGQIIEREMLSFFNKYEFEISISLDGKEENHNLHRVDYSGNGSFDKAYRAAQLLNEELGDKFSVRATVTTDLVEELSDNIKWFIDAGFRKLNISIDLFTSWDGKYEVLERELEKVARLYLVYRNRGVYIDLFDANILSTLLKREPLFCNAGDGSITVDADGTIYPCIYGKGHDCAIGDINTGLDKWKLSQSIEKHISLDNRKFQSCQGCDIAHFCHARRCGFLNLATEGFLNKPCKVSCEHEKIVYKEVVKVIQYLYNQNDEKIVNIINAIETHPELERVLDRELLNKVR